MVEHIIGSDEVVGSLPADGSMESVIEIRKFEDKVHDEVIEFYSDASENLVRVLQMFQWIDAKQIILNKGHKIIEINLN